MSKLVSLIKYSFINSYGLNKSKKNKAGNIFFWIVLGIVLMLMAFSMLHQMLGALVSIGMPPQIFLVAIVSTITITIIGIDTVKSPGTLFNSRDFQMLAVLPVSEVKIILAKVLDILLTNYAITLLLMIPGYVVYFSVAGFDLKLLIMLIIAAIFVPFIPMSIGILLGFIFYKISSKFKYKEMAVTGVYVFFTALMLIIIYSAPKFMPYLAEKADYIIKIISKIYMPFEFYTQMVFESSIKDLLLFAGSSIVVFAVLMFIIRKSFFTLNSRFTVYGKSTQIEFVEGRKQSKVISLLKTEFLKYISKGSVVLNTAIGGVIYIIIICLQAFGILDFGGAASISIAAIMGCFMFTMSPTTATSISLEGKAFSMKKSLPIKPMDILLSKIFLNVCVNIPFIIIGAIFTFILNKSSIIEVLTQFVALVLALLAASVFGMVVNLKVYDFSWNSETEVVKRGKSVIITMIPSMIMMFVLMGIQYTNINIGLVISLVYGILFLVSGIILFMKGEKWYIDIEV